MIETWLERIGGGEKEVKWVNLFGPLPPEPKSWKKEGLRWLEAFNASKATKKGKAKA